PIDQVLRTLTAPRNKNRSSLFQVMFILQTALPNPSIFAELSGHCVDVDPGTARADLLLELHDADVGLSGWLEYSTDLFEAGTIARMGMHLQILLESILADPDERIS